MANKLFLVCATLALCFLLTNASIYRSVVEFDEDDDTKPMGPVGPRQKCRKEFQQAQHLRACQKWIKRQMRQGPFDDEFDLEDDMENPKGGPQQPRQLLHQCCNELREEEPVCVCPTLKRAAKAVRLQGQHGPFQASKIYRTARNLPQVCSIPQVDVCPFKAIPFFPPYY
ncbi:2S seed storage protein 3 [Cardamine amara subsp. amara]|uniref:2S seed storage protein 3 n=1 Tax=Cardamine amara subsp. amara TaxID=228776 RepID=A0ABD1A889_CARAN